MFHFVCQHCNTDFERPSRVASNGKPFQFCSLACSSESRKKKDRYRCPECQKEFTYKSKRVYCSRGCYHAAKRRKGTYRKTCQQCGNEYEVQSKSAAKGRKFCSKACSSRVRLAKKLKKLGGPEGVRQKLYEVAKQRGYWLGSNQAKALLKVRHEFFDDIGVSLDEINRSLGYTKPKSGFEELVLTALETVFPDSSIEREVSGPKTETGYPTRFDFVVDGQLVIEADGPQHTDESSGWYSEEYVKRDRMKEAYCERNGLTMIRIRHSNAWTESRLAEAINAELSTMNHNVASNGERDGLKIIVWG